jgi:hypothetical protein
MPLFECRDKSKRPLSNLDDFPNIMWRSHQSGGFAGSTAERPLSGEQRKTYAQCEFFAL